MSAAAPRSVACLALPVAGLLAAAACAAPEDYRSAWRDQLIADSPCYRVDLLDGLDPATNAELRDLYACISPAGQLAPLDPVLDALDAPLDGAMAPTVGGALVGAVQAWLDDGVDVWGLAGVALDALALPDEVIQPLLDLVVEVLVGQPAADARAGADLADPTTLAEAPAIRLAPVLRTAARAMRDTPHLAPRVAGLLGSQETARWVDTVDAYARSSRPQVRSAMRALPGDLGLALQAVTDTGNDRWSGATGNSLADLLELFLVGDQDAPLLDAVAEDALIVGTDARVRERLPVLLSELHAADHLERIPDRIAWMASVDRQGGALQPGEISALAAFVRMLDAANRPFRCEVRVLGVGISADLGNLAVEILDLLSRQDAEFLVTSSSVLSGVLGAPLTDTVLDAVVDSGVCPVLTRQLVDDLGAVEVLKRDEAYDLLVGFLGVLDLLRRGEEDHLDRLADVASVLQQRGAVEPFEELVRDLGPAALMVDVMRVVPPLLDPAAWDIVPSTPPLTMDDVVALAIDLLAPRTDGVPGSEWSAWAPLAVPLLEHPGTWRLADALAALLVDPTTRLNKATVWLPDLLALDPDGATAAAAALLLDDPDVSHALAAALAEGTLVDALLATSPEGDDPRVPVVWTAGLIVDGTLSAVLHLVDLALSALEGS